MERIASRILKNSAFQPRNDEDNARALFLCAFSIYFFFFLIGLLLYHDLNGDYVKNYNVILGFVIASIMGVLSAPMVIRYGGSTNLSAAILFSTIFVITTANAFFYGGELEVSLTVWYFIFILGISLFFGKEMGLYALMLVMTTASVLVTLYSNGVTSIHPFLAPSRQSLINIPFELLLGFLFLRYMINHFLEIHQSASQKLFKSQQLYNLIADNYPNGAISIVDNLFKVVYIKGRALDEMDATPNDFIGKTPYEIRLPEVAEIEINAYRKAFRGERSFFELPVEGQIYSFICEPLMGNKGLIDQILVVSQNITRIRQAQQELQNAKASLEAIINNSRHLIFSIDLNYTIQVSNQYGRVQGDDKGYGNLVAGTNIRKLRVAEDIMKFWENRYERAFSGEAFTEEFEQNGHDWEVSLNPIHENGVVTGAAVFVRDIDQRKAEERELREAKQKAENAAQAKADFLSTMSHEIRTPLNAVIGLTHLLLHEEPQPHQLENLNTLKFSSENLLSLINDILDFSKIESGKISFEEADFSLQDHLNGIYSSMTYKAREKGIGFNLLIDKAMPPYLCGDPGRLSQVLNNLIGNAIKFTNKGLVEVKVAISEEEAERLRIDFTVSDTGIGIPAGKINSIFDSFTQAETNTTRRFGGTGLGLAITRRLLNLQGSEITVESTEGIGTVFGFSLWFGKSENRLPLYGYVTSMPNEPKLYGLHVLVAEDNEINQLIIKKFLLKWGLQPVFAVNGNEAVKLAQAENFDIVLMDLQMPELDGFEATRQIRSLPDARFQQLPIIGLTADANPDIRDSTRAAGMNDLLTKPFNPNDVYAKLIRYAPKHTHQPQHFELSALTPEKLMAELMEMNQGDALFVGAQARKIALRINSIIAILTTVASNNLEENWQSLDLECRKLRDILSLFGLSSARDEASALFTKLTDIKGNTRLNTVIENLVTQLQNCSSQINGFVEAK